MASILGSFNRIVHDVSAGLIDSQVTDKLADAATTVVKVSFDVAGDVLKTVRDLTAPEETEPEES